MDPRIAVHQVLSAVRPDDYDPYHYDIDPSLGEVVGDIVADPEIRDMCIEVLRCADDVHNAGVDVFGATAPEMLAFDAFWFRSFVKHGVPDDLSQRWDLGAEARRAVPEFRAALVDYAEAVSAMYNLVGTLWLKRMGLRLMRPLGPEAPDSDTQSECGSNCWSDTGGSTPRSPPS